jgi:outer membrane protein assembly factor BamD
MVFFLGGCASVVEWGFSVYDDFAGKDTEEMTSSELMAEAMEELEKGKYEGASEKFQMIKDRYPYSKYAIMAELKMADALYRKESYEEAYDAYDEFERLHPKNQEIPYVIYQKGMCHFQKISTVDRDPTSTHRAIEEFERLTRRFPRDEYANRARKNIRECLIHLAEYELYVGHWYFKKKRYQAAMDRYSYIIENYPDMGQYHEALEYITRCKEIIAREEEDEGKFSRFIRRIIPYN